MANTTITRTPDAYTRDGIYWSSAGAYDARLSLYEGIAGYELTPGTQASFSAASIEVDFGQEDVWTDSASFVCRLYSHKNMDAGHLIGSQTWTLTNYESAPIRHKFNFTGLSASGTGLYFKIEYTDGGGIWYVTHPTGSATYTVPALGVSVEPGSVSAGSGVTLSFTNRFDQSLSVQLSSGSTQLTSFTVYDDSRSVETEESWFTSAGVTGNSMRVDVRVFDGLGRTATASFTVTRSGLSVSVSPSTCNVGNTATLSFSGNYGRSLTVQLKYGSTLLQTVSTSSDWLNVTPQLSWFSQTGVTGSMRVDVLVTDSTGRTASANFTAVLPALTVSASPASLYTGSKVTITLGNRLEQTVTLVLRYQQTELYWTTLNAYSAQIVTQESWFETASVTGNTMQVTAVVSDGLGRSASASFTLNKPTGSTATPTEPVSVTKSGAAQIAFKWTYSGNGTQTKAELQWKTSSGDWQDLATVNGAGTSYTAPAYRFPLGSVQWRVRVTNSFGIVGNWSSAASFSVTYEALGVRVSPSSIYINSQGTLTFTNRLGRTLLLEFRANNILLQPAWECVSDQGSFRPSAEWFETAGATGSSLQVTASVSDDLGRTASFRFTAVEPQGSTATPTAPRSTTVDGASGINFAWFVSSDWGPQINAELQWSTDNAAWEALATISGNTQTWTAPAIQFPAGQIYWRVRVTNAFGILGEWSNSVSFTVNYSAVSQVVQVNSQTSGIFARGAAKAFSARFEASGPVYSPFTFQTATFKWRAGTSGDWTDVTMTSSDNGVTVSATIPANTFPAGVMQWRIEGTDNTGRTTSTPEYTLTAATSAVDVTPIRPVNTVETNNSDIGFELSFVSLDGSLPQAAEWKWSSDGEEWHSETLTNLDSRDGVLAFTVPAGTFPAGTIQWQARAENSADTWGDWSPVISFKALGAPVITAVTGDGKPFLTITWQTPAQGEYGQQAYKIEVDGTLRGPYFGPDVRSYTLKEPLEDGAHKIRVSAQNRFDLWAEWAEASVSVTNVPGPSFNVIAATANGLTGVFLYGATIAPIIVRQPQDAQRGTDGDTVFMLSYKTWQNFSPANPNFKHIRTWEYKAPDESEWHKLSSTAEFWVFVHVTEANDGYQYRGLLSNAVGELYSDPATFYWREPTGSASELREGEWKAPTGWFMIYRNGKYIGKTYENIFMDGAAIGETSYEVLQVLPGGYYTRGVLVQSTVDVKVDSPTLFTLDGAKSLHLTLSEDARRSQDVQRAREVAYTQYEGAVFPEAEIGEHESLSVSGDCAWTWEQQAEADAFEALLGTPVIYKTPGGEMVVGVLDGFSKRDAHFYRTARFTIQQMDWRDFRDEP